MLEENQDAQANSSSALEEAIASTPEVQQEAQEVQGTEPVTPQKTESPEQNVPFNEHPRFKELIEERNWYRTQLEQRMNQPQPQVQPQQPTTLPQEMGNTPEEREFWALQRRIAKEEAEKVAKEQTQQIAPAFQAVLNELTGMKVKEFRREFPDVKPDSYEEKQIAQKIQQASSAGFNLSPREAYWMIMGDKKIVEAESKGNINLKQKIEAKKQANMEQHSTPQNALPPVRETLTLRQRIEREANKLDF